MVVGNANGESVVDGTTSYFHIAGRLNTIATEADVETPIRDAGTFKNLFTYVATNTITIDSTVITLRKSQVATSVAVSYGSDQTGIKEDTSNTATFAATDEVSYEINAPADAGFNTISLRVIGIEFVPDTATNSVTFVASTGPFNYAVASTTRYIALTGTSIATQSSPGAEAVIQTDAVSSDLYVYISANARTTDTTFSTRKNATTGSQSVTYTAGQTGAKEDVVNSDSLAEGDTQAYEITTGTGTETITIITVSSTLITTNNKFFLLAQDSVWTGVPFNTSTFNPPSGGMVSFNTDEANSQIYPRFSFTVSKFLVNVFTNTIATSASTVTVRDNGNNGSLTVSYDAGQSGEKTDGINSDVITSGTDKINYNIVTPNTSGEIRLRQLSVIADTTAVTMLSWRSLTGVGL